MNWKYVVSGVCSWFSPVCPVLLIMFLLQSPPMDRSCLRVQGIFAASRFMAADASEITQVLTGDDSLAADISVTSSGPILVSDYASGRGVTALSDTIACVFTKDVLDRDPESELYSMGILSKGRYATSRVAGPGLTGGMDVNGPWYDLLWISCGSQQHDEIYRVRNVNMTIHDFVKYGGKL